MIFYALSLNNYINKVQLIVLWLTKMVIKIK